MASELDEEVNRILQEIDQEKAQRKQLEDHILRSLGLPQQPTPEGSQFQWQEVTGSKTPRQVGPDNTMTELAKTVIEGTGMMGGGLRGAAAGARLGPYGALAGGVLGSALGGASGRSATTLGEEALGLHDPRTVEQRLQEVGRGALEGGAGELGAQAILNAGRGVKLGIQRLLGGGPATPAQQSTGLQAERLGVVLRPSEITGSATAEGIETSLRRSIAGRGIFKARDLQNEEAFTTAVQSFADKAWGEARAANEVEDLIQRTLSDEVIPDGRLVVRGLYDHLGKVTGNQPIVNMTSAFQSVQAMKEALDPKINPKAYALLESIEKQISEAGPVTGMRVKTGEKEVAEGVTKLQSSVGGGMVGRPQIRIEKVSRGPDQPKPLDFLTAHDIRSNLLAIGRQGEPLPGLVESRAKQAAMAIDGSMAQAASQLERATGQPITQAWRFADTASRDIHEFAKLSIVKRAMREEPAGLYDSTLGGKNAVRNVMNLRDALQNYPEVWQEYQRGAMEHLIHKARQGDMIQGKELATAINKVGEKVGKVVWGDTYPTVKQFGELGSKINSRAPKEGAESPGMLWRDVGMLVTLPATIAGGTWSLLSGSPWPLIVSGGGTATYLIGARQISKMLNNPQQAQKLVGAMRSSQEGKTGAFVRLMSNLMTTATMEAIAQ
jgi:hypothetical protein